MELVARVFPVVGVCVLGKLVISYAPFLAPGLFPVVVIGTTIALWVGLRNKLAAKLDKRTQELNKRIQELKK